MKKKSLRRRKKRLSDAAEETEEKRGRRAGNKSFRRAGCYDAGTSKFTKNAGVVAIGDRCWMSSTWIAMEEMKVMILQRFLLRNLNSWTRLHVTRRSSA